jgi:hypothetical protein
VAALNAFTDCEDTDTPQGKAFKWLQDQITINANAGGGNAFNNCDYEFINERYSLVVFYFATDPNGVVLDWRRNPTDSECDWNNIICTTGGAVAGKKNSSLVVMQILLLLPAKYQTTVANCSFSMHNTY